MTFGEAIELLKSGSKLQRSGWNGKNMYILLMDGYTNIAANAMTREKHGLEEDATVSISPYIVMKTAQEDIQPGWLASQSDILAEDWEIHA